MWQRNVRRGRWLAGMMLLAVTTLVAQSPKASRKTVADLVAQVRAADPAATIAAREAGTAATPALVPLTHDANAEVREIALLCLAETGGPEAVRALLDRTADDDPTVRAAALRGLHRRATAADGAALLDAATRVADPDTHQALLVLLGQVQAIAELPALRDRCAHESNAVVQDGCIVARAWLGDDAGREAFRQRLIASRGRARAQWVGWAEQIRAAWLVPALPSLLDDEEPVRWIGVDGRPGPETLRVCDVAVNLVTEITGRRWSFAVRANVQYTPRQRDEVRAFLGQSGR